MVIDVGMNRLTPEEAHNKSGLVGDVDYAAAVEVASAITSGRPGAGPTTIAFLLQNTLKAARMRGRPSRREGLRRLRLGELLALAGERDLRDRLAVLAVV